MLVLSLRVVSFASPFHFAQPESITVVCNNNNYEMKNAIVRSTFKKDMTHITT